MSGENIPLPKGAPAARCLFPSFPVTVPGVSRVLKCCQDCGVQSLVFTSSSDVVSSTEGIDDTAREQRVPYVAEKQGATVHAVAMAEAEIIEAR